MKNIISIFLLVIFNTAFTQQIHVKYKYVKSPIVTIYENLYINKKGNVISIQDSLVPNSNKSNNLNPDVFPNLKSPALYYISDLNNDTKKDFHYLDNSDDEVYFVYDKNVPKPDWEINDNDTKKIAGFVCTKAKAEFRGSTIIAYFAKDLPYSAGPYKFFGLPGLILDVRVEGKSYDLWRAESVNLHDKKIVDFKPKLNQYKKIQMKDFVQLKDQAATEFQRKKQRDVPIGSTFRFTQPTNRFGVEIKYEWE